MTNLPSSRAQRAEKIQAATSQPFPAGLVGEVRTGDLQEMAAAVPPSWVEERKQLGYGRLSTRLLLCCTSQMALARAIFVPGIFVRGPRAADTITLYICFQNRGPACLRGQQMRPEDAFVLQPNEETDFRTMFPFDVFVLAVERERLESHAITVLGCPLSDLRSGERVVIPDVISLRHRANGLLSAVIRSPQQYAALLQDPAGARAFEKRVMDSVLVGLQASPTHVSASKRRSIAWDAQEFLRTHLDPTVTIHDVCRAMRATARTLHRAFQEQFGTTPKAYLKMLRLNGVRDDLQQGRLATTVTDVAIRWGFLHFGWFAHDYRAMFGESPSQTLARARLRNEVAVSG